MIRSGITWEKHIKYYLRLLDADWFSCFMRRGVIRPIAGSSVGFRVSPTSASYRARKLLDQCTTHGLSLCGSETIRSQPLSTSAMSSEFNILTPNAMLGYGYRVEHFWYGVEKFAPKAIIVDSGSTDGGPYKLGLNKMTCGRDSYIRDLTPILKACFYKKIQVLIGSVGGDGSDKHVQEMFEIVQEIATKEGFSFKVATINAGFQRDLLNKRIVSQKVGPCGPVEELTVESADRAIDVVAQMGAEPYATPDLSFFEKC